MKKVGRRRDEVWERVTLLEGVKRWKCNDCGGEFGGSACRIKAHLNKGKGIRPCTGKANSSNDTEHNLLHSQGQIQGDAKHQERIQVGSSFVSNWDTEDFQMIQYVFESLSPRELVFRSPRLHLTQNEFITLKPGTWLDPWVIDIFVEILTESEKKKATPSNWYLPVMFSTAALERDEHNFKDFVHRLKMRENHIFDQESPEKLFAMEILFEKEKGALSNYKLERANDILSQDNGQKEREDLALKLLTNDLNQEKQNLYDKARRRPYAQVEKQDGNERLRVDASETYIEAKYDDKVNRHDGLRKGSSKGYLLPTTDLIGWGFQRYTEQIWEWIMDDKVSAIGVWGIGGSGKTTLATHIHNKLILEEAGSDIKVIWVTVSQKYSISHLQKVIARSIELDVSEEFEVKRIAGKLLQAFKEMKKCVVILDDVWDHFFLKEIGFPMSDNRIKFILTTRILEVCQGMGCEKNIVKVESLDQEDSWALFEKIMGFHEELPLEVRDIARNISHECEGLPLAIVRIATSMKGKKQVREWSHMLECFVGNGRYEMDCFVGNGRYEMDKWVLPALRSSYDFLTNKLQRFFLYYVLNTNYGCLYDDNANQFIRRFVYESIDETTKLRVLYNEGYNMLYKLKNHSLLDRCNKRWEMNKFLRALAITMAEDIGKIMANAYKNLTEIPSDDQWKDELQKVFLTGNKIETIVDSPSKCSKLSTLLLDGNTKLNYISNDFFYNMPALKTLDLSETKIKCLPESVSSLKCLNTLLLLGCNELSCIPPLRNLKWLILLDLSLTAITEAPLGLESFINLRYLNLLQTPNLVISALVISKLINLEHLGLDVTIQGGIQEYSMKRITLCDMDLRNGKAVLPGDIKKLVIRDCQLVGTVGSCLCSLVLSYGHNNNNNPHQIEWLDIWRCEDVEYLCCFSGSCPFCSASQLVGRLCLSDLEDLKDIVSPNALLSLHQPSLFSYLTHLQICNCDSMETLMTPKLLALLQNLRTIDVNYCGKMKEIVGEDDLSKMELGGSGDLSHPTPITFPRLTSLELQNMPLLNFVYRGVMLCPSLQTFLAVWCEQLDLPQIEKTSTGYSWAIKTD
ncbi:hypothetical protein K1719_039907 [Acacia pycnantha]|nr:hypothetical protein K1719_039907 [Acacia pycnantha]